MSSASTHRNECPECESGELIRVLTSKTYTIEGKKYEVPGLMPYKCESCGAFVWPDSETRRAQEVIKLLREQAA